MSDPYRDPIRKVAALATRSSRLRRAVRSAAQRGWIPQPVYGRLPPGVEEFTVTFRDGTSFEYDVDPSDPFVRQLFWRGMAAAEGASLMPFHERAKAASLVVDVGGHTGLYTLAALAAGTCVEVLAFEPVPVNASTFEQNLARNGWANRCEVVRSAVSDTVGVVLLHIPFGDHPMSGSMHVEGFRGQAGRLVEVPCVSLDVALAGRSPQLVKIDVEGFEDAVLRGMGEVVERCRPVIFVECYPDGPIAEVEGMLRAWGYRFQRLDFGRSGINERLIPDPSEVYRNVACLPG